MKEFSIYLLIVNIFTFIVYGVDKLKAKEHWWRVSEATQCWRLDRNESVAS